MQFVITDNLSGIKEYRAMIDNKWVLLENDAKKSTEQRNMIEVQLVKLKKDHNTV